MKLFNKIILTVIIVTASACSDDFLNLTDPNSITTDSFWSSPEDAEAAIVTLYPTFNALYDGAAEASNLRSDAVKLAAPDFAQFNQFYTFINTPINGISDDFWNEAYALIFRVNTILKQMELIEFSDQARKDKVRAEALFFRGAAYFRLAHMYGQVPIVLEPAESEAQFNNPISNTHEAVWDQAVADLQIAKAGLPVDAAQPGRVTKGAATGFLGKLYLYRAGYLADNSYYGRAATEFQEVIDLNKYGLVSNWLDNFTATNENNEESIYEAQYDLFTGAYEATQPRPGNASVPGISGEIISKPSEWIFNEMSAETDLNDEMDVRLLNTIYFEGGNTLFGVAFADIGDGLVCGSGQGSSGGGGGCTESWEEDLTGQAGYWDAVVAEVTPGATITEVKLEGCYKASSDSETENIFVTLDLGCRLVFDNFTEELIGNGCEASNDGGNLDGWFRKYLPVSLSCYTDGPALNNERILRYADILLMHAEAVVKSGGAISDAIEDVNAIRARADLPIDVDRNGDPLTADNIMAEIEHQRVMEFTLEGHRYYDLIRWGNLVERLNAHGFPDGASNVDVNKHKYYPYPVGEVNSNEMIEQNPLWR